MCKFRIGCIIILCVSMNFATANILNVPARLILSHVQLLQELKARVTAPFNHRKKLAARKATSQGPTQAYLSLPAMKENVERNYGGYLSRSDIKAIVAKIKKREQELCNDYYVFYHGQEFKFRILQDILKTLLHILHIQAHSKHFVYMRIPEHDFALIHPETFITTNYTNDNVTDHENHIRKRLLAVNLSLFGSSGYAELECTFNFFVKSCNIAPPRFTKTLEEFFEGYGFPSSFIEELHKLYEKYKTFEGNLIQIFIPKGKIDECAYLSLPFGRPYNEPIVDNLFDQKKKRHSSMGAILDKYYRLPQSMPNLDRLQGRLIISNETLLNPNYGIQMYRYTTMHKDTKKRYKAELQKILEKLVHQFIENGHYAFGFANPFKQLLLQLGKAQNSSKTLPISSKKVS